MERHPLRLSLNLAPQVKSPSSNGLHSITSRKALMFFRRFGIVALILFAMLPPLSFFTLISVLFIQQILHSSLTNVLLTTLFMLSILFVTNGLVLREVMLGQKRYLNRYKSPLIMKSALLLITLSRVLQRLLRLQLTWRTETLLASQLPSLGIVAIVFGILLSQ